VRIWSDSTGSEWGKVLGCCEYGNKFLVSNKRRRITYCYERQCSEEGLCLWTKIPQLVSMQTLCYCNAGQLHDNKWSLCLCNMLLLYSCKLLQRVLLWCQFCLFYTDVSGECADSVVTMASSTWMLKIRQQNSFKNCWIGGGEEKGPDQFIVWVCVIMLPWKQRLYSHWTVGVSSQTTMVWIID